MNVLVCPTAYKGTLSAGAVAAAMARGARAARAGARVVRLPLSDGGPGLLDALTAGDDGGRLTHWRVTGPLGEPVTGRCLWRGRAGREAVIESADACGLHLLGSRPAPLDAHTLGVGELVARVLEAGADMVRIGLGGSASTDGGTGLGRAFGYRFVDAAGRDLPPGGGALSKLDRIEPGTRPGVPCTALADVETLLVGPRGAARSFAAQKGAEAPEVERLELALERLDARLRADLGEDVGRLLGSGAAGGLGAGCAAFLGAELVDGSRWVMEAVGFEEALAAADLVVTGEGAFDETSRRGKVVGRVLEHAAARGTPVVLACGRVEAEAPEAATVVTGDGRTLGAEGIAAVVREGVRRVD